MDVHHVSSSSHSVPIAKPKSGMSKGAILAISITIGLIVLSGAALLVYFFVLAPSVQANQVDKTLYVDDFVKVGVRQTDEDGNVVQTYWLKQSGFKEFQGSENESDATILQLVSLPALETTNYKAYTGQKWMTHSYGMVDEDSKDDTMDTNIVPKMTFYNPVTKKYIVDPNSDGFSCRYFTSKDVSVGVVPIGLDDDMDYIKDVDPPTNNITNETTGTSSENGTILQSETNYYVRASYLYGKSCKRHPWSIGFDGDEAHLAGASKSDGYYNAYIFFRKTSDPTL